MKKLLTILFVLITLASYGKKPKQKVYLNKHSVRTDSVHRAYRRSNRELRELGFELDLANTIAGKRYLVQRDIRGILYQVYVKAKRKRIVVEIYTFVEGDYPFRWVDHDRLETNMDELYRYIRFRVVENKSMPPVSAPFVWSIPRNKIYNEQNF